MARDIGNQGEAVAERFLIRQGYAILEHQFHSRYGEIDLIIKKHDTIIFVEVKAYKIGSLTSPYYAVSKSKQSKIKQTAKYYLMKHALNDDGARFDVVIVEAGVVKDHFEGAFS
jgi:putative endonuclease